MHSNAVCSQGISPLIVTNSCYQLSSVLHISTIWTRLKDWFLDCILSVDSNATLVLSVDSQLYIWTGCSVASRQYACGVLSIHSNLIFHKHMEWYKFIGIWKSSLIISWDYESGRNIIIVLHKRMCTREFIISPHQWHKNLLSHR